MVVMTTLYKSKTLTDDIFEKTAALSRFMVSHWLMAFGMYEGSVEVALASELQSWLYALTKAGRGVKPYLTKREIFQRSKFRQKKAETNEAINLLVNTGKVQAQTLKNTIIYFVPKGPPQVNLGRLKMGEAIGRDIVRDELIPPSVDEVMERYHIADPGRE
jgi:hypothetical protein